MTKEALLSTAVHKKILSEGSIFLADGNGIFQQSRFSGLTDFLDGVYFYYNNRNSRSSLD